MEQTHEMKNTSDSLLLFDPIVVVRDVLKNWLVIVLAALAVGVGCYILTDMEYAPRYQAKATLVVTSHSSSATVYSHLSSTSELAAVYTELINSSVMRKNIESALGTSFSASISAAVVPQTNLLNMTVTASDPRTAFLVAQAIIDHHEEVTYQVVEGVSLEVLQGVEVPMAPINRADAASRMRKMMILAAAAAAAVFAWFSIIRDTVRSGQEARKKLDCDYLGEIPHENKYKTLISRIRRRKSGILISNPVTSFHYVESVRKLVHRVEQHMDGGRVLMVTSVLENEGKSSVAVNMALTLAQKKRRVLLIDFDLHKPACHKLLELKDPAVGTCDVLTGKAKLGDACVRYKRSSMFVIPEKRRGTDAGDLLSSENMRKLIGWARQEFDFVVLDLPPMAVASDAETMTDLADASLLVVRQNQPLAKRINKAVAALEDGKAQLLGCVLNDVHATFLSSGQGYRYGGYGRYNYYYGGYGHYGEKTSRK